MASRLKEEDLRLNIIVNGDKGRKEILDLEIAIVSLTNFGYYMEWTAHIQKKDSNAVPKVLLPMIDE